MTEQFNYYRGTTGDVYRSKPGLDGTEFFNGREWISLTGSDREMRENPDVFEALPGEPVMATKTEVGSELTRYGFTWGGATVTRCANFDGTVVIEVAGDDKHKVNVYVSPTGRSVRVFKDGQELKAVEK